MSEAQEKAYMGVLAKASDSFQTLLREAYAHVRDLRTTELKHVLLRAQIDRNTQARDAICSLAFEAWVEDGWILLRSMLEGVTNICYLQIADAGEAEAFVYGEAVAARHTLTQFEKLLGEPLSIITPEHRKQNADSILEGNRLAGREISHKNWSKHSFEIRIIQVDTYLGLRLFRAAYREIYSNGNQYVHGNFRNVQAYFSELYGLIKLDKMSRIQDVNLLLSQMNKVMFAFCAFLDHHFQLGQSARIMHIVDGIDEGHVLSGRPGGNFTM